MKLSPTAALSVCNEATARGLVVARVEGGMWHSPGFEARLDCIWDGTDPPIEIEEANTNNRRAADFVRNESDVHSVFVITAPPIAGWPHKSI